MGRGRKPTRTQGQVTVATYRIRFQPYARRELDRLPEPAKTRVERAILALAFEPRPPGARLLAGTKQPTWRIRIGDYRVLYQIHAHQLIVLVVGAGHRRDVYRHRRISEIATARYEAYRRQLEADQAAAEPGNQDPGKVSDILDRIPGAWEDVMAGVADIDAGRGIPLEDLGSDRRG
jgi:mRNA interferase RelE/StbE